MPKRKWVTLHELFYPEQYHNVLLLFSHQPGKISTLTIKVNEWQELKSLQNEERMAKFRELLNGGNAKQVDDFEEIDKNAYEEIILVSMA